jgi:hypothetical protein
LTFRPSVLPPAKERQEAGQTLRSVSDDRVMISNRSSSHPELEKLALAKHARNAENIQPVLTLVCSAGLVGKTPPLVFDLPPGIHCGQPAPRVRCETVPAIILVEESAILTESDSPRFISLAAFVGKHFSR